MRVWDLRTGAARGDPLRGPRGGVHAVAVGEVDGTPVAVSGGGDGTVRVWDLRTGTARGKPLYPRQAFRYLPDRFYDSQVVQAVAVGAADGTPVAITGGQNRQGAGVGPDGPGRHAPNCCIPESLSAICSIALITTAMRSRRWRSGAVDGTPVAVTGGHDGTVRVWDLRTGSGARTGTAVPDQCAAICFLETPLGPSGSGRGRGRHPGGSHRRRGWHGADMGPADRDARAGNRFAATKPRSKRWRSERWTAPRWQSPAARLAPCEVWDLRTGTARGDPLRGHTGSVQAVAIGEVDGTPVAVTGGGDGTVRVWDLRARPEPEEPCSDETGWIQAVAVGELDGVPLAVTADVHHKTQVWNLQARTASGEPFCEPSSWVEAVAVGEVDGAPVAVTGGWDGTVRVWDLRTGVPYGKPILRGAFHRLLHRLGRYENALEAIAVGEVDGTPVAVTVGHGRVRVWDLRTGKARRRQLRSHTTWVAKGIGWWATAVAVGKLDSVPVAVTGHLDGRIRVWDLRTGKAHGKPLRAHTGYVEAVAVGEVDGTPVAVTGGMDSAVRVWDLRTGTARGNPLRGHAGSVKAVAVGEADGQPVAVTGDSYGTISMWALDCDQRASVCLEAPAGITAISFARQVGWLTSMYDGSLFIWRQTPTR